MAHFAGVCFIYIQFVLLLVVGLASPLIGLESKNGVSYEWQSTNTTDSNMFNDWHSTQPDQTAVGSCAQIFTYFYKWIDISKSYCRTTKACICELR